MKKVERVVSAGGVVYRTVGNTVEVVIGGLSDNGVWGLPKGTPASGESLEATAVREVSEETGLKVALEEKIGSINYWFVWEGVRYFKTVHYYLMSPIGGSLSHHDPEYDVVKWVPAEEACSTLSYQNEVEMVRKAVTLIAGRKEKASP